MNSTPESKEFECCVLCGTLTDIPISMPVNLRENYVIGCGQLCTECVIKQQKTAERKNTLTAEQILYAIEQSKQNNK